jgi:hypothetical protein
MRTSSIRCSVPARNSFALAISVEQGTGFLSSTFGGSLNNFSFSLASIAEALIRLAYLRNTKMNCLIRNTSVEISYEAFILIQMF